jgi:hypothetical protein
MSAWWREAEQGWLLHRSFRQLQKYLLKRMAEEPPRGLPAPNSKAIERNPARLQPPVGTIQPQHNRTQDATAMQQPFKQPRPAPKREPLRVLRHPQDQQHLQGFDL